MRFRSDRRFWLVLAAYTLAHPGMAGAQGALRRPNEPPVTARTREIELRVRPRLARGLASAGARLGAPLYIRVLKEGGEVEVWAAGRDGAYIRFQTYRLCGAAQALGPRRRIGDQQAPEGFYLLTPGRMDASARAYLSLALNYPNGLDTARRWTGAPAAFAGRCAAAAGLGLTDPAVEELWALASAAFRAGQRAIPVHIFPFALTSRALRRPAPETLTRFWAELEPAWRLFEAERKPPATGVRGGRYVVSSAG